MVPVRKEGRGVTYADIVHVVWLLFPLLFVIDEQDVEGDTLLEVAQNVTYPRRLRNGELVGTDLVVGRLASMLGLLLASCVKRSRYTFFQSLENLNCRGGDPIISAKCLDKCRDNSMPAYWGDVRLKFEALAAKYGPPQLMLTLAGSADTLPPELFVALEKTRTKVFADGLGGAATDVFTALVRALTKNNMGNLCDLLGLKKPTYMLWRLESCERGPLHIHVILGWAEPLTNAELMRGCSAVVPPRCFDVAADFRARNMHNHSTRCQRPDKTGTMRCCFKYPMKLNSEVERVDGRFLFPRSDGNGYTAEAPVLLLGTLGMHGHARPLDSEIAAIAYITKYFAKCEGKASVAQFFDSVGKATKARVMSASLARLFVTSEEASRATIALRKVCLSDPDCPSVSFRVPGQDGTSTTVKFSDLHGFQVRPASIRWMSFGFFLKWVKVSVVPAGKLSSYSAEVLAARKVSPEPFLATDGCFSHVAFMEAMREHEEDEEDADTDAEREPGEGDAARGEGEGHAEEEEIQEPVPMFRDLWQVDLRGEYEPPLVPEDTTDYDERSRRYFPKSQEQRP
jgi:hypothetical protein